MAIQAAKHKAMHPRLCVGRAHGSRILHHAERCRGVQLQLEGECQFVLAAAQPLVVVPRPILALFLQCQQSVPHCLCTLVPQLASILRNGIHSRWLFAIQRRGSRLLGSHRRPTLALHGTVEASASRKLEYRMATNGNGSTYMGTQQWSRPHCISFQI